MAITKLLRIKQTGSSNPSLHLKRNIDYICNPEKTGGGLWISGNAGSCPEAIIKTMEINKEMWGKRGGTQGFHYVLSFHPESGVDESMALKVAEEFCQELLGDNFYYCIAVHNDQPHMHTHVTFDSVSKIDGYKFHSPKGDWEKRIQPITDRICKKYGLETLRYDPDDKKGVDHGSWESSLANPKNRDWLNNTGQKSSSHSYEKACQDNGRIHINGVMEFDEVEFDEDIEEAANNNRMTWHDILRDDIDDAVASSMTYAQFLEKLKNMKYEIRDGKYLTLKAYGQSKAMRTRRLGPAYEKEAIIKRIQRGHEYGNVGTYYGDRSSVNSILRNCAWNLSGWRMSEMQAVYYVRYYRVCRLRRDRSNWDQKQKLLSLSLYARQISFMVKHGIRTLDDLNEKKEETNNLLKVVNRRISDGDGERDLLLAFRRELLKRIRLCDGIAKENLSAERVLNQEKCQELTLKNQKEISYNRIMGNGDNEKKQKNRHERRKI